MYKALHSAPYEDVLKDLLKRKEFANLRIDPAYDFRNPVKKYNSIYTAEEPFRSHSHQLFAKNLINPSTPYNRLLVNHATGSGKSPLAIAVALEFINVYKRQAEQTKKVSNSQIVVLGFTHDNFKNELIKFPEFGFATQEEINKLERLRLLADKGVTGDIKYYRDYDSMLKRRITSARSRTTLSSDVNTSSYGYFKFYGYQALVNRVFIPIDDTIDVTKLIAGFSEEYDEFIQDIEKAVTAKLIIINWDLINNFKHSLIICDEIHNTYNSITRNNWGVTIQFILNYHEKTIRAIFLSATPINNSPTEIVDMLTLLLPRHEILKKTDLFINDRTLKPGAADKIRKAVEGRVSFLQDSNIKYYPETKMSGVDIKYTSQIDTSESKFPYFKFVRCPMSDFQQNTYEHKDEILRSTNANTNASTDLAADANDVEISRMDTYSLRDIAFPNPQFTLSEMKAGKGYGLYHSGKVRDIINNAPQKWRKDVGVEVSGKQLWTLEGEYLERSNIKTFSSKLHKLLETLDDAFKIGGKCFVYHHRVNASGILLAAELLRRNGILDEYATSVANTLCTHCSKPSSVHKNGMGNGPNTGTIEDKTTTHKFQPMRFILIHGAIDLASRKLSFNKFNSSDNMHGTNYRILLGSQVLMESFDIKAVRHLMTLSIPDNIPDMIQLFGRVNRKNSHSLLPPKFRNVTYYVFVTSDQSTDVLSHEELIYGNKLLDYLVIQDIEQILHEFAVDAHVHRDIIMSPDLIYKYFGTNTEGKNADGSTDQRRLFGNLYFEAKPDIGKIAIGDLQLATFTAYHNDEEINAIKYVLRKLFIEYRAMTYNCLWSLVKKPPFSVETNPKMFTEENFLVALNDMMSDGPDVTHDTFKSSIIQHNFNEYQIVKTGDYFVMLLSEQGRPIIDAEMFSQQMSDVGKSVAVKDLVSSFDSNQIRIMTLNAEIKSCKSNGGIPTDLGKLFPLLSTFNSAFHYELIEKLISGEIKQSSMQLYKCMMYMYERFEILLYPKHIPKSNDTLYRIFKNKSMKCPIGYTTRNHAHVFHGTWTQLDKQSIIGIPITIKENNCIVGFFDDSASFKVRRPAHKISAENQKDIRMIEHGMVCQTKSKNEITEVTKKMGVKVDKSKIKAVCDQLLHKLMCNELAERKKSSANRVKWFYMFNEEQYSMRGIRKANM
jgi:hypothetical protein